ncbi:aspartate 1-decarboxylase [bacterium]|nr:MAG: aspartate 1-decarboxylase [bacterium]
MLRTILKSKIHRATVTEANLQYEGSITIDRKLLIAADILPGEKVEVLNLHNGSRQETYAIEGKSGSGVVCLNGPAARHACKGDILVILAYGMIEDKQARKIKPQIVFVDGKNRIAKK